VTNAPEIIVKMKRGKIVTHYTKARAVFAFAGSAMGCARQAPGPVPAWQSVLGMSSSLEVKVFYPT
jgi:hypothetical protein